MNKRPPTYIKKEGFVHKLIHAIGRTLIYKCELPDGRFVCYEAFDRPIKGSFPNANDFGINYNSTYLFDEQQLKIFIKAKLRNYGKKKKTRKFTTGYEGRAFI